jgi:hypothetical protein
MSGVTHRRLTALAAAVLVAGAAGCSSDDTTRPGESRTETAESSPESSPGSSSGAAAFTADAPALGDDLLVELHQGVQFEGGRYEVTWQLPRSYEAAQGDNTRAYSNGGSVDYRISAGAGPGGQAEATAAAESVVDQAEGKGQSASLDDVTLGEHDFTAVTHETEDTAVVTLYHAPSDGSMFYIFQLAATTPLAEIPARRVEEFRQSAASLRFTKP